MNEEGPDARRFRHRAQNGVLLSLHLVAAVQRPAATPAASRYQLSRLAFNHVVGPVRNEPGVRAEHVTQRAFDLRVRVVTNAQGAHRLLDEAAEPRNIRRGGMSQLKHDGPQVPGQASVLFLAGASRAW